METAEKKTWKNNRGATYTNDELYAYLSNLKSGIVILSGPSMCGKTAMLKRLQSESGRKVSITEYSDIIECIIMNLRLERDFGKQISVMAGDDIFAVENIDFLKHKETTQIEFASIFKKLSDRGHLVIATGIDVEKRVPVLIDELDICCEVFEFIS